MYKAMKVEGSGIDRHVRAELDFAAVYEFAVVDESYDVPVRMAFAWRVEKLYLCCATYVQRRDARL